MFQTNMKKQNFVMIKFVYALKHRSLKGGDLAFRCCDLPKSPLL